MVVTTTTTTSTTSSPSSTVVVVDDDDTGAATDAIRKETKQEQPPPPPRSRQRRRGGVKIQVPVHLDDFMALEDPHPFGVLPGGNLLFGSTNNTSNTTTTTRIPLNLSESLWQDVLSYCDGITLGRIVQVSRYCYVSGHQPELWRDLVLRQSVPLTETSTTTVKKPSSWKDLYVVLTFTNNTNTNTNNNNFQKHIPINMSGKVYSDFLYRNHLCRSFAIPAAWKEDSGTISNTSRPVKAIDYERLTAEQFFNDYERPNIPLLIRGAASTTRAFQYWKDPQYLLRTQQQQQQQEEKEQDATTSSSSLQDTTPSLLFRATSGAAPLPANFSLSSYLNYCQSFDYWEESPLYLFDRNAFLDPNHPWSKDFFDEFYQNCPYWNVNNNQNNDNNNNNNKNYGHDLLQYLGSNEKRPDHTWIIMGPKRSGSVFHLDPNATHAWNVSLKGRKRWIFYPPGVAPPGVHPSEDGDEVALPISVGEWILQYWQEHVERSSSNTTTPIHERPYECTAHPGDAIFVPHGWWHMVINLDGENNGDDNGDNSGDYNLAMTHNYVSPSNLGNVLKFFKYKQDQISGCRDRIETIKPEYLHDAFVSALQDERNNVPPQFLQQAQEQKGWTCKAFETTTTTTTNHNNNKNNKKKKKRKRGETTTTSSTGEDNEGDNNNNNTNNKQQDDGTSETAESTNINNINSVMAKANTCSTPFSFSFL